MARHPRLDAPGTWHHVMNRGIARRTLFESRADIRTFLARLALEVRAGRIEVHAFCILTTHFHLLVRSTSGELSAVMQHVQNEYSRWFNRGRRRDGPLFRGRFRSKPIETQTYRELLVRYVDANSVAAGLVPSAEFYPYGSAWWYARERGPVWLQREWVESTACRLAGTGRRAPDAYRMAFGPTGSGASLALVERRLVHVGPETDPLDHLLDAAVPEVREWMRRKAALADGTATGVPVCDEGSLGIVLDGAQRRLGAWQVRPARRAVDAWPMVHVALLRDLCGSTLAEAGARTGRSASHASVLEARHRELIATDELYATRAAELAQAALERCHRRERRPRDANDAESGRAFAAIR
jgi:REP element-mobilizing transposase RayT